MFARILLKFGESFELLRSLCIAKLIDGIMVHKSIRISKNLRTSNFNPIDYFSSKKRTGSSRGLESFGYGARLLKFDFQAGEFVFLADRSKKNYRGSFKDRDQSSTPTWKLETRYPLSDLEDLLVPETTLKMLKSRMREYYPPNTYYVYNEQQLRLLSESPYFLFELKIRDVGRIECLAEDFSIFLDIYCAIQFLHYSD